jgi:hypothetical protein
LAILGAQASKKLHAKTIKDEVVVEYDDFTSLSLAYLSLHSGRYELALISISVPVEIACSIKRLPDRLTVALFRVLVFGFWFLRAL